MYSVENGDLPEARHSRQPLELLVLPRHHQLQLRYGDLGIPCSRTVGSVTLERELESQSMLGEGEEGEVIGCSSPLPDTGSCLSNSHTSGEHRICVFYVHIESMCTGSQSTLYQDVWWLQDRPLALCFTEGPRYFLAGDCLLCGLFPRNGRTRASQNTYYLC